MSYHEYTPKKEPCINCVKTEYIAFPNGIFRPSSLLPSPLPSPPAFPCHFPLPLPPPLGDHEERWLEEKDYVTLLMRKTPGRPGDTFVPNWIDFMLVAYSYLIVKAGKLPLPWENPRQRRIHRRNQHLYWIKVIFIGLKLFQGPLQSLILGPFNHSIWGYQKIHCGIEKFSLFNGRGYIDDGKQRLYVEPVTSEVCYTCHSPLCQEKGTIYNKKQLGRPHKF